METFTFLGLSAIQSETLSILLIIAACSAAYCFIVAGAGILNWSVCGAVLLILLFLGSSTLGEYISKSKYPEYAKYIKGVNRYFPGKSSYICEQ